MTMTISDKEIAWTLCNLVGIVSSLWLLTRTYNKRKGASPERFTGRRLKVARRLSRRNMREESAKLMFHICGVMVGFLYMTRVPELGTVDNSVGNITAWILITMSAGLALSSMFNLYDDFIIESDLGGRDMRERIKVFVGLNRWRSKVDAKPPRMADDNMVRGSLPDNDLLV